MGFTDTGMHRYICTCIVHAWFWF